MTDQNAPTYYVASVITKCKADKILNSKIIPRPQKNPSSSSSSSEAATAVATTTTKIKTAPHQ